MKRLAVAATLVVCVAGAMTISRADRGSPMGCTATTGAAVPAVGSPVCSFTVGCVSVGSCGYIIDFKVNGTGLVSGSMGEVVVLSASGDTGQNTYIDVGHGIHAHVVGCGPTMFTCSVETTATPSGAIPALFISGQTWARVTCTGGGPAVIESVSCSVTQVL